jgi:hypothetical protein
LKAEQAALKPFCRNRDAMWRGWMRRNEHGITRNKRYSNYRVSSPPEQPMISPMRIGLPGFLRSFAACLIAGSAGAFAQSTDPAGGFSIQAHAGPRTQLLLNWSLAISGQWPTHCPPTLENITLDDHDLRIDARSVLGLCERGNTPFSVELNPTLALQRGALAPGVYRVSFYAADGAQSPAKLRAFALLDRSSMNTPALTPETGFWWTSNAADANRTTLSLELQNGQLSVALLSYDDGGQPVWYFGAAPYAGHVAHLPLRRLAGGSGPFVQATAAPRGDAVLTLDLEFHSAAHASAWLTRVRPGESTLQLQTLDLMRLPLADSSDGKTWSGDWVLVADAPGSTPARLRFDQYRAVDAAHFQIVDSGLNTTLICSRTPAQPDWPPVSCTLRDGDNGSGAAAFPSVALGRMDGIRNDGVPVHLLRVTP